MTEILFTLTTIYVAYVIYGMMNQSPATNPAPEPVPKKMDNGVAKQEIAADEPPAIAVQQADVVAVVPEKPAPAVKAGIRNPQTGEVAAANNNYRFTKRWIKEALVAEGLLTKVYKNNELDAAAETAIKHAMMALAAMDKYRV